MTFVDVATRSLAALTVVAGVSATTGTSLLLAMVVVCACNDAAESRKGRTMSFFNVMPASVERCIAWMIAATTG